MQKMKKVDPGTNPVALTIIRSSNGLTSLNWRELWAYRELLYFLTWREIKVRYKQTALGVSWAIIQPFFMMVVFALFFGQLAKIPSDGIPYPIFNYAAILPWTLFADAVSRSSNSTVQGANLIKKVYFPRLLMPLSGILSSLVDFFIAFIILIGLMFYYGYPPTLSMFWLLPFSVLAMLTALGVGLWLSTINVQYRDIQYIVPFLLQVWLFASPVVYSSTLVPERFQTIYGLNPMAGVIEGFRWALFGTVPRAPMLAVSIAIVAIALIFGAIYFRYKEKTFADLV